MTVEELIEELIKCCPQANVYSQQYDDDLLIKEVMGDKSRNKVVLSLIERE
jgi:hypothetical protein